jgi:hypothetical protein
VDSSSSSSSLLSFYFYYLLSSLSYTNSLFFLTLYLTFHDDVNVPFAAATTSLSHSILKKKRGGEEGGKHLARTAHIANFLLLCLFHLISDFSQTA